MKVLFSIIVPVYNVEKYLSVCIDSVLKQSYNQWELLLIDDGSSDKSGEICNEYAKKDSRIRVFHKKNSGVSSARNVGLDNVRGNWITFVDSDDELLPTALLNYHNQIMSYEDIDIVKGGYYKINEIQKTQKVYSCQQNKCFSDKSKIVALLNGDCCYHGFLWNECIRSSIIDKLRFDESLCWNEDNLFSYECFCRSKKIAFLAEPVYLYYIRSRESLSNVKNPVIVLDTCARIFAYRIAMLGDDLNDDRLRKWFRDSYINMFHLSMKLLSSTKCNLEFRKKFRENIPFKDVLREDSAARLYLDLSKNVIVAYYLYVIRRCINMCIKYFS